MTGRKIALALFRNDLRTHDNPLLSSETLPRGITHLLPIYVFDERMIELSGLPSYPEVASGPAKTRLCGFWRTGAYRSRFLAEAVFDLRDQLRKRHSDLAIRYGLPEVVADRMVEALQKQGDEVLSVCVQKEICQEEVTLERKLERRMKKREVPISWFHTKPLIHPDDLPFKADEVPNVYTTFRKQVEGLRDKMWRPCLPVADKLLPFPELPKTEDYDGAEQLSLHDVIKAFYAPLQQDFADATIEGFDKRSAHPFPGGETTALERLGYYFSSSRSDGRPPPAARYKTTRNGMLGADYSTKMSAFLAIGCISPRRMMQALEEHENAYGGSKDSYWIQFELLWLLYAAIKFDNLLFRLEGFESATDGKAAAAKANDWNWWQDGQKRQNRDLQSWMDGKTGVPLIDANMSELRSTGFMSNRGRQNVASFLSKDLGYDWRIGAEFFESTLVDYDPTALIADYGNWQYNSGVGNDPRAHRQFNPIKQARDYDAKGEYIATWLPQLAPFSIDQRHVPWLLTSAQREQHRLTSHDFPERPIIEQNSWKAHYKRNRSSGNKSRGRGAKSARGGQRDDAGAV